ncbi:hypothetical protein ACFQU2_14350 [Siccirubricoccus deserti]|uniref:Uncharacterized protein n=1 Tax=Siccirubricoccus deserti TaxID=2013562 RepID=A0A9X0R449_9PROT|nr:hypothetical protein [Siccirubricoccus deserti]MBC4018202.1 hypothetical protein [Siccirubricoccus deserti]
MITKREANQQQSLAAFLAKKAEFDALLADLQQMSEDHFGADPEAVLWGQVGNLESYTEQMRRATDAYFKRGEHAE